MKKLFLFAAMCLMALSMNAQYVDLGLPSGAQWKSENESGGLYTYEQAAKQFGGIPSLDQWIELKDQCVWTWKGGGFEVKGPNGASIYLPAAGYADWNGNVQQLDCGFYWSSTEMGGETLWILSFNSYGAGMIGNHRACSLSVRLVR